MEVEINIKALLKGLLKRLWVILLITLVVTLLVAIYTTWFVTPAYRATVEATIMINDMNQTQINNINTSVQMMGTYASYVTSDETMTAASALVNGTYSPSEIRSMINVSYNQGSLLLRISATSASPDHAAVLANQVAIAAQNVIDLAELNIIRSAVPPQSPTSPSLEKNMLYAFVFTFAAACLIFLLIELYNNKISSEKQLSDILGVPVIGSVPRIDMAETQKNTTAEGQSLGK